MFQVRCVRQSASQTLIALRQFSFEFGKPAFWSEFYNKRGRGKHANVGFEWFCEYGNVSDIVLRVLAPSLEAVTRTEPNKLTPALKVLHLGCGTSLLGEEMHKDLVEHVRRQLSTCGHHVSSEIETCDMTIVEVWNIDNSPEAINAMKLQPRDVVSCAFFVELIFSVCLFLIKFSKP